jgi:hypothetical protein
MSLLYAHRPQLCLSKHLILQARFLATTILIELCLAIKLMRTSAELDRQTWNHSWDTKDVLVSRKPILLLIDAQKLHLKRMGNGLIRNCENRPAKMNTSV